jgi:hypothetical protein
MLKRVLIIGLAVGVGIVALYVSTAEAGRWIFILPPGMWWNTGSLEGCANIGRVPNPLQNPAAMECEVTIPEGGVEARCVNPQYHNVLPGEAANKYFLVSETIDPEDMSLSKKEKGVANVCVSILDEYFGVKCKLRNWHPEVLVTEFESVCTTRRCLGTDDPDTLDVNEACISLGEPQDTQVCHCTLPGGYTLDDPPDPGTPYMCIELDGPGGDPTGDLCELSQ